MICGIHFVLIYVIRAAYFIIMYYVVISYDLTLLRLHTKLKINQKASALCSKERNQHEPTY